MEKMITDVIDHFGDQAVSMMVNYFFIFKI
jgi:hypothetical protein